MVEHQTTNLKVMGAVFGHLYCSVTLALFQSKELVSTSNDTQEHSYDNWLLLHNQNTIPMALNHAQAMLTLNRSGCYQNTFAIRRLVSQTEYNPIFSSHSSSENLSSSADGSSWHEFMAKQLLKCKPKVCLYSI